ncbi:hypothetical protein FOZ60_005023, partial [Perkinsus olseni]
KGRKPGVALEVTSPRKDLGPVSSRTRGKMTVKTSTFAVEAVACLSADLGAAGQGAALRRRWRWGRRTLCHHCRSSSAKSPVKLCWTRDGLAVRDPDSGSITGVQIKVRYADNREELVIGEEDDCWSTRTQSSGGPELTFAQSPQAERDHLRKVFHEGKGYKAFRRSQKSPQFPTPSPDCASISIECCHTNGELYVKMTRKPRSGGGQGNKFEGADVVMCSREKSGSCAEGRGKPSCEGRGEQ